MRRLLLLIALCVTISAVAQRVTEEQALLKAQNFMKGKTFVKGNKTRGIDSEEANSPFNNFYVFNAENDEGYVIVSGDERTKEVLGFSERGHLNYDKMPCNLKSWLEYYEKAIDAIPADLKVSSTSNRATRTIREEIAPLIKTAWHQYNPFNQHCPPSPEYPEEISQVGCVALAMGQVMNYYKYPDVLPALDAYTYNETITVPALEQKTMDWNNDDDLLWMLRYCGQSVEMQYGYYASGSYHQLIPNAMVNKYGYDGAMRCVYRNAYDWETWDNMMYKELAERRPIIYRGVYVEMQYGHAFICDGYKDGYYHANWGWGGAADGYYSINVLDSPFGYTFSDYQGAIIGIQPDKGGTPNYNMFTCAELKVVSDMELTKASSDQLFPGFTVYYQLFNHLSDTTDIDIGFYISNSEWGDVLASFGTESITPIGYFVENCVINKFPLLLPDGTYTISLRYKKPTETEWHLPTGGDYNYITATIKGDTLTFKNYPEIPCKPSLPTANATVDIKAIEHQYNDEMIYLIFDWTEFSNQILEQLDNITQSQFDEYYHAECIAGYNPVPAVDAPFVTPTAYFNDEGLYYMKTFNFGTDIYGNDGIAPDTGSANEDDSYMNYVMYTPVSFETNSRSIRFHVLKSTLEKLIKDQTSPVTFTRWVCFSAKADAAGNMPAPYRYVWIKFPIEISWDNGTGMQDVKMNINGAEVYYDLNGKRVPVTHKGIYIKNGKKVMR